MGVKVRGVGQRGFLPRAPIQYGPNPYGKPSMGVSAFGEEQAEEIAANEADGALMEQEAAAQAQLDAIQNANAQPEEREETIDVPAQAPRTAQQVSSKQALAQALMEQGRRPVQGGWTGGLANLASTLSGAYLSRKAQEEGTEVAEAARLKKQQLYEDAMSGEMEPSARFMKMIQSGDADLMKYGMQGLVSSTKAGRQLPQFKTADINRVRHNQELQADGTYKTTSTSPLDKPKGDREAPQIYNIEEYGPEEQKLIADLVTTARTSGLPSVMRGMRGVENMAVANTIRIELYKQIEQDAIRNNPNDPVAAAREKEANLKRQAVIEQDFAAFGTELRRLSHMRAAMGTKATEANNMAEFLLRLSNKVPRGNSRTVNEVQNWFRSQTNEPKFLEANVAMNSFINAYANAIKPLGATVSDMEEARHTLNMHLSTKGFEKAIKVMQTEMEFALESPTHVADAARKQYAKATARGSDVARLAYYDPQTGELKQGEEVSMKYDDDSMVRDNWKGVGAPAGHSAKPAPQAARKPSGRMARVDGKLIDTGTGLPIKEGTIVDGPRGKEIVENGDLVLYKPPAAAPKKPMVAPGNVLGPRPH